MAEAGVVARGPQALGLALVAHEAENVGAGVAQRPRQPGADEARRSGYENLRADRFRLPGPRCLYPRVPPPRPSGDQPGPRKT